MAIALTQKDTGKLIDVNRQFCELSQFDRAELIGKTSTELGFYTKEQRGLFLKALLETGETKHFEMNFKVKDGSILNALL